MYEFRELNGVTYTYARINGFYGWYELKPTELPELTGGVKPWRMADHDGELVTVWKEEKK